MNHLRPHQVFDRLEDNYRLVRLCLPQRESLTSMLERGILVSLVKLIDPRTVFEFGTYMGETTLALASNTSAKVFSIDLGQEEFAAAGKIDGFESANARKRLSGAPVFAGTGCEGRIETITGDSTSHDLSSFYGKVDFVLIDGGHHIDVVRSDTEKAFRMLSKDRASCIVWHDYGNPHYKITEYLDGLSKEVPLFHVAETSYVFHVSNASGNPALRW